MARDSEPPVLDFERPVVELERKIDELREFAQSSPELQRELRTLETRVTELQQEIFADLTPWQKVLLSRHPGRPYTLDYLGRLITGFTELHGDRGFGDDAEARGQAEAIAKNLEVMARLPVPIICAVIGEGGSGGALALGVADRILMMEYATYSVISPEGCASILWRDDDKKAEAAAAMKMTAPDLQRLGIVDEVVPESPGGAHRDFDATARNLGTALRRHLGELAG